MPFPNDLHVSGNRIDALHFLNSRPVDGEYDITNILVYPYIYGTSAIAYNANGSVNYIETTDGSTTWRMTMNYTLGAITSATATNGIDTWTKVFNYSGDIIISTTGWY